MSKYIDMKNHMTEMVKCDAVSCASNHNRHCRRDEITIDEKGRCRQYSPRKGGSTTTSTTGGKPYNMMDNYEELRREAQRLNILPSRRRR